jgi:hypothetical protein
MKPVDYNKLTATEKSHIREEYAIHQKNLCWFCHGDLDMGVPPDVKEKSIDWDLFPRGFMKNPIHLQHDHETGMTEGAVHAYCNAVLWQYLGR